MASESRGNRVVIDGEVLEMPQVYFEPIREVVIDCLAVMKIVKHCNDNLPSMVAGSLLGIDNAGVLEVTCVYPFPAAQSKIETEAGEVAVDDLDGSEYQNEMLKMLQKINVDSNCVGWYTSMYFGSMCTTDVVNDQFNYQSSDELSNNSVVIMYDPLQSKKGSIVIKAFRLSDQFVEMKRSKGNDFIAPTAILEEIPVRIQSSGHVSAFVRCISDSHRQELNCTLDSLSFSGVDSIIERNLELVGNVVDDLLQDQQRLQQYARMTAKPRIDHVKWLNKRLQENADRRENGDRELSTNLHESGLKPIPEVPSGRLDHLLSFGQLGRYSNQINDIVDASVQKLIISAECSV